MIRDAAWTALSAVLAVGMWIVLAARRASPGPAGRPPRGERPIRRVEGLADLLIQLVQLDIAQARETRRLARQVLRLTRVQTGDLSSADVGDDTA